MKKVYFTLTGLSHYYGSDFLKEGTKVYLKKEPDNAYDHEAIEVSVPVLGKIGYVANSTKTVEGKTWSAGRVYDHIHEKAEAKVIMNLGYCCICKICKKSLRKRH